MPATKTPVEPTTPVVEPVATPPANQLPPEAVQRSGARMFIILLVIVILAGLTTWWWQTKHTSTKPLVVTASGTPAPATTAANDALTQQLQAVSGNSDTTTLKAEINGTNTASLANELDTAKTAANGL